MHSSLNNDSLVYSQAEAEEQDNLLSDSTQLNRITQIGGRPHRDIQTVKFEKNLNKPKLNMQIENDSLTRYLLNESEGKEQGFKSFRKLGKDKQKILNLEGGIQKIAMSQIGKNEKINQLVSLIEAEKILHYERKLKQYELQLIQLADDIINQRKNLQKEVQNIIQLNKVMSSKMKSVEKYLQQLRNEKTHKCSCRRQYSFSKQKQSPIYYLDRFQFAKTMIGSIQQLQLKRVEEEEQLKLSQMPFIQLILSLKNKAEDPTFHISQGLIDRIAVGPTLKEWVKKIQQKLGHEPNISDFSPKISQGQKIKNLLQFVKLLKDSEQNLIENIENAKDPERQMEILRYSTQLTYLQILKDQISNYKKEQAISYFGEVKRFLITIQKKMQIELSEEKMLTSKNIIQEIESMY